MIGQVLETGESQGCPLGLTPRSENCIKGLTRQNRHRVEQRRSKLKEEEREEKKEEEEREEKKEAETATLS